MVGEDKRSNFAFCDTLVEDSFVGCQYFDVSWSWTGGGKVRKGRFFRHRRVIMVLLVRGEEKNVMLKCYMPSRAAVAQAQSFESSCNKFKFEARVTSVVCFLT